MSVSVTVLSISLAAERFVAIVKTLFPWLSVEAKKPDGSTDLIGDRMRRLVVQFVALFGGWITASLFACTDFNSFVSNLVGASKINGVSIPNIVIGFMSTGGSAFWTSIVAYASALKDIKIEQRDTDSAVG